MTYNAYTKAQNTGAAASPRDLEYRLLGAVTAALLEADETGIVIKRVDAVCWNRDVWAAFRRDLNHPHNALPQNIKDDLIDLAKWVDRETFRILSGETIKMDGLIEVNKNIMNGLKPPATRSPEAPLVQS